MYKGVEACGRAAQIHLFQDNKNGFTFPEFHSLGIDVSFSKGRQVITCKNKMEEDFVSHLKPFCIPI